MAVAPLIVRAPGRVNLIGEHTDYNDGFVMPIAIDRHTDVTASPRTDDAVLVVSDGFGTPVELSLAATRAQRTQGSGGAGDWHRYVQGVIWALQDAGHSLRGADLRIQSSVPAGAGLSSSAALEVACGFALLRLAGVEPALTELALACQRAENDHVGARCGIMDQYIACHGRAGHALLLDCRRLEHTAVPLRFTAAETRIVICNSMVRHSVAGGEYNRRRAQCEAGVQHCASRKPGVDALRDLDLTTFARLTSDLDPLVSRRCRHVIAENDRVLAAAEAIARGDAAQFGRLMFESHASLRDDFEVSCAELDLLVDIARACDGVYGARMTGGGFGGCTVNLVRADAVAAFTQNLSDRYADATGERAQVFVCQASDGVHIRH